MRSVLTCTPIKLPGGGTAIVCGSTPRCRCGNRSTLACDWKVSTRKSGTCDARLCPKCTTSPAPGKDLCAKHVTAFAEWKAVRTAPPLL